MPPMEATEVVQVVLVKRKPGMTREEFQKYWRDVHGPLTTSLQKSVGFSHYEQWHNTAAEGSTTDNAARMRASRKIPHTNEFDGLSLIYFKDMAAFEVAGNDKSPERKETNRKLMEDNAKFIDIPNSPSFLARQRFDGSGAPFEGVHPSAMPPSKKSNITTFLMIRKPDWTRERFQDYYQQSHGRLGETTFPTFATQKYIQLHNIGNTGGKTWGTSAPDFEGMAVIFNDPAEAAKAAKQEGFKEAAKKHGMALIEDENRFLDIVKCYAMETEARYSSAKGVPAKL